MTITLCGENDFTRQQEARQLVDRFVTEYGDLSLEKLDGNEVDLARLQEALTSLPFLANKKMVVLRSPSAIKDFTEQANKLLANVSDLTTVLILEPKLDRRLNYFKFLKQSTDFKEFNILDSGALAAWIVRRTGEKGGKIGLADARYLIDRVGNDQQLLDNELDKLLINSSKISRQTIDRLTEPTPQGTIFQLLQAAFAGNAKRAIALYQEQRALKIEPPQIIAMLAWQLKVIAIIKTAGSRSPAQLVSDSGLSPNVVQKSRPIADNMSLITLKKLIADLLTIDVRSKSEAIDVDEALQYYLLNLAL